MLARKLLFLTIALIILSPLIYFSTGIGQQAHTLSQEPVVLADGSLQSSPKAEALHRLSLPIRIERLLIYPALLFLMQYSGLAVKLKEWLKDKWLPPIRRVPGFNWLDQRLARLTRNRLSLVDVVIIALYLTLPAAYLLAIPFAGYAGGAIAAFIGAGGLMLRLFRAAALLLLFATCFILGGAILQRYRFAPCVYRATRRHGLDVCPHCGYWLRA